MPKMQYLDHKNLVGQIVTRASERKIFQAFLDGESEGVKVADRLYALAQLEATILSEKGQLSSGPEEVVDAVVKRYKQIRGESGLSGYDEMILDLVAAENNNRTFINNVKSGKMRLDCLPRSFPGMRKRAEVLFRGKVRSDLKPNDFVAYQTEKQYASILRQYTRDLFFAIKCDAEKEASPFLHLLFSLRRIETSEPLTSDGLKRILLSHLKSGEPLDIVHIKSLRFTYPGGTNLKVLEDTAPVTQPGLDDEIREYPSEEVIFQRLSGFRKLLEAAGIKTRATVIVSDYDLEYCFPAMQKIVPVADVQRGRLAVGNYIANLSQLHPEIEIIRPLSGYLAEGVLLEAFNTAFDSLVTESKKGGGRFISEQVLEMRVEEQFIHYKQMFGSYSRELARHTTICNIASLLSLSVLFNSFPSTPLLVIDNRGLEDRLIGGFDPNSVVKFFTKLKDPVKIERKAI